MSEPGIPEQKHRERMVGWYDPDVLARSAVLVTLANLFGRHSDTRLLEALGTAPQTAFGYEADSTGDFWIDYVSDVGDGWNSTYAIAQAMAQDRLTVEDAAGRQHATQRGRVLVLGGDCVYPYPSREAYAARTEAPYGVAFAPAATKPDIFAIPGNHDWYDSLVAFSRLFCRPGRRFAGMPVQQGRSYFALRLPRNWWLLGIDLQLGADFDEPQLRFFQEIATQMSGEARIVLCVPSPQWLMAAAYPGDAAYDDHALRFLEQRILQRPIRVYLTGDLHCYRRHEAADGVQKVVSGGGGAFLHPTHAPEASQLAGGFTERASFPDASTSRRLSFRNLLFPILNPAFGWGTAWLYFLTAWFVSATLTATDLTSFATALASTSAAAIRDPLTGLWLLAVIGAFVFFTDTHVAWYRVLGGIGHALSHLAAAFLLAWLAVILTVDLLGFSYRSVPQLLVAAGITFVGGWLVGSFVLGCYLLISLQIFGRHNTEAFSSLRIQDYKQWLRLKIAADGSLTLHAIGIDRVPRRWLRTTVNGVATLVPHPADRRATAPRLVDTVRLVPVDREAGRLSAVATGDIHA